MGVRDITKVIPQQNQLEVKPYIQVGMLIDLNLPSAIINYMLRNLSPSIN